jgi:hypothetical protein
MHYIQTDRLFFGMVLFLIMAMIGLAVTKPAQEMSPPTLSRASEHRMYISSRRQDCTLVIGSIRWQTKNDLIGTLDQELRIKCELIGDVVAYHCRSEGTRAAVIIPVTKKSAI